MMVIIYIMATNDFKYLFKFNLRSKRFVPFKFWFLRNLLNLINFNYGNLVV